MWLTNQKACGIIKVKYRRAITMNTHFMLDRATANAIALTRRTISRG